MAVGAIELDVGTVGRAANGLHMERVIQLDGAGITVGFAGSIELWMAVFKAKDV